MATALEQSLPSTAPYSSLGVTSAQLIDIESADEGDDGEYEYVSRLAEQIAHAMLEDDDEDQELDIFHQRDSTDLAQKPYGTSYDKESVHGNVNNTKGNNNVAVSHFAALWRDYGPTEWDCFYNPSQYHVLNLSPSLHHQLEVTRNYQRSSHFCNERGIIVSRLVNSSRFSSFPGVSLGASSVSNPEPKSSSSGTGVFLPKVTHTSFGYRRTTGLSTSRSAHFGKSKF
ncbi:hypothetical protein KP509_38G018800 [Ceratopteris richardii]|uniref:Uncharacterized protein n=1 Tax=Ceratopteris richardii TaxID=49495 RepID=A0A8T2Q2U2_CERRI|nr:hypothetical protein KP509_38G018800 [Ceratopteris richardii]